MCFTMSAGVTGQNWGLRKRGILIDIINKWKDPENLVILAVMDVLPISSSSWMKEALDSSAFAKILRSVPGAVCFHCFLFSVMSSGRMTRSAEEQEGFQINKSSLWLGNSARIRLTNTDTDFFLLCNARTWFLSLVEYFLLFLKKKKKRYLIWLIL